MNIVDAIRGGDLEQVRQVLNDDPMAVHWGTPGEQPVHYAAWFDKPDILDELVGRGADINACDAEGRTPLHYATLNDHPEPVRRLIQHRAKLNPVDQHGFTPLVYAIRERTPEGKESFSLLIAAGADYDLHAAVSKPDPARVREIMTNDPGAFSEFPNQKQLLTDAFIGLTDDPDVKPNELLEPLLGNGPKIDADVAEELGAEFGDEVAELLLVYAETKSE